MAQKSDWTMDEIRLSNAEREKMKDAQAKKKHRRSRRSKAARFVMRLPWDWIVQASKISGRTAVLGIALWFWAGMKKTRTVKVSHLDLAELGISRDSTARGLRKLERAGLVAVTRQPGCSPIVTLLDAPMPR